MILQCLNGWMPAIISFFGVAVGATVSYFATISAEKRQYATKAKTTKSALQAEVKALLDIIKIRRFMETLDEHIKELGKLGKLGKEASDTTRTYTFKVPDHYSRVYQTNVKNIGMLDTSFVENIITFHQRLDAVVQDVTKGGVLSEGKATIKDFEESREIFKQAIELGESITSGK